MPGNKLHLKAVHFCGSLLILSWWHSSCINIIKTLYENGFGLVTCSSGSFLTGRVVALTLSNTYSFDFCELQPMSSPLAISLCYELYSMITVFRVVLKQIWLSLRLHSPIPTLSGNGIVILGPDIVHFQHRTFVSSSPSFSHARSIGWDRNPLWYLLFPVIPTHLGAQLHTCAQDGTTTVKNLRLIPRRYARRGNGSNWISMSPEPLRKPFRFKTVLSSSW